ncbi:zonular occludens toxin domain-containing protein [Pseudomonas nitroreducens]|uniref:zonular occludens toxin domain-containing protein n=1 Tax=Pseudomonas nitroreducens TaxID=46680 RepID=UPI0023FA1279|nr:zonular occludens toxin domain-containing protein [Pseudomonas nitroreducens]WEW97814.1 zonular occludens toxin domain-containing protein [Pseudomonas nitroreducens]
MSIKIHHGPNGSYKTSGAIQDDAVPALKEGRVIITNVRGFTLERAYTVFPDLPNTSQIINLDLESLADLEQMRTWFQWAPRGAFLIFDETQLLFPKSWREKDLEKFDYPGGPEAAHEADRPMGWLDAWTRHRHFNWDIVLTTPNISYIRDDIRMTSEMAYKHSNLAVIGIPGRYKEAQHDAQLNRPPADGTIVEYKRIKQQTFALYQSTATGKTQDTKAGKSLLRSPKLVFLLALLACTIGFVSYMGPLKVIGGNATQAPAKPAVASAPSAAAPPAQTAAVDPAARPSAPGAVPAQPLPGRPTDPPAELNPHPFAGRSITITAHLYSKKKGDQYMFAFLDADGRQLDLTSWDLVGSGYAIRSKGACVAELMYEQWKQTVTCVGATPRPASNQVQLSVNTPSAPTTSNASPPHLVVVPDSEYASRPWRKQ